jgi:hypothetical protein
MRRRRSRKISRFHDRESGLAAWLLAFALLLPAWGCASAQDTLPDGVPRPLRVGVAVFLNDAGKISEQSGSYEASIDVRYRWRDPSLAFNAKELGGDRLEFGNEAAAEKLRKMWSPRLMIANQLGTAQRTEGGLFIYADGTIEQIQRVRTLLDTRYRLAAFPFDTQGLTVRILSTRYTTNQVDLVQDQGDINASGIRETMAIPGWTAKRMEFSSSRSRGWNGDSYPEIQARVVIQRQPFAHLFSVLTPFLLLLLVPTIMTLYAKADVAPRMTLWGASILALIALSFTFSVRYPALGSDSLIQQVITIGFAFQLMMIALTVTLFNPAVADRLMGKTMQAEVAGFLRWSVPILIFGLILTRSLLTAFA